MHTLCRFLVSLTTGSMTVARWTFNCFFSLLVPFFILAALAWATDSSGTLFWASLTVRASQAVLVVVWLLAMFTMLLSFGALIAAGFIARAFGHEDFSNFSL